MVSSFWFSTDLNGSAWIPDSVFTHFSGYYLRISPGLEWDRYVFLFTGVETITFTAVGWLFGREVSRGEIRQAEHRVIDAQEQVKQSSIDSQQQTVRRVTDAQNQAEQRVADAQEQAKLRIDDINKQTERLFIYAIDQAQQRINSLQQDLKDTKEQYQEKQNQAESLLRDLYSIAQDIIYMHRKVHSRQDYSNQNIQSDLDRVFDKLRHIRELQFNLL
jgi:hypothetical protein